MKVLHVFSRFLPHGIGGTEVYINGLARELRHYYVESEIAIASTRAGSYEYEGTTVHQIPVEPQSLRDQYRGGSAAPVSALMDLVRPRGFDVIHLHGLSWASSAELADEAHRLGLAVVVTFHVAANTCVRSTLLRWGRDACDGRLRLDLCTRCALSSLGVPRPLAEVVGRTPVTLGNALDGLRLEGPVWTGLRLRSLVAARHTALHDLFARADAFIAISGWMHALLLAAGAPPDRVSEIQSGIGSANSQADAVPSLPSSPVTRIAYLGRMDPAKGPHLVAEAIHAQPDLPVAYDMYAGSAEGAGAYGRRLAQLSAQDPRIRLLPTVPNASAPAVLAQYDAVAIPSCVPEAGPLGVLESFAAGVPVLGSRAGAIAEWVTDEVDGLLIEMGSAEAWTDTLARVSDERALLQRLRAGVRPPRSMTQVAAEMAEIYRRVRNLEPCASH